MVYQSYFIILQFSEAVQDPQNEKRHLDNSHNPFSSMVPKY